MYILSLKVRKVGRAKGKGTQLHSYINPQVLSLGVDVKPRPIAAGEKAKAKLWHVPSIHNVLLSGATTGAARDF